LVNEHVLKTLTDYFFSYLDFYGLSDEKASEIHMSFLAEYHNHLIEFSKTLNYPYQNNIFLEKERLAYDIPLLCSSFLSYHRYLIFETLYSRINIEQGQKVLVIGVGPGIELAFLNPKLADIFAYDKDISSFIIKKFPSVVFNSKLFRYDSNHSFDKIILIELLEHLENPHQLLLDAIKSLTKNGRIHFTTAVNIPQFDHLYNFMLNDVRLENFITEHDCEIEYKLDIPHPYKVKVDAYNCYYIIKTKEKK